MSEEIIKVIDYIGAQLGIAIDWTAENVLPQVLDILGRYRILKITGLSIWLFVFIACAIALICYWKPFIDNYKSCINDKKSNLWFKYNSYYNEHEFKNFAIIYTVLLICYLVIACVTVPFIVDDMLKWLFIPEIKYLELLKGYIP